MIGGEHPRHEPAVPSRGLPPEPGIAGPGPTEAELIEVELAEPEVAEVEAELEEAYREQHAGEQAEDAARRERRMAERHERAAEDREREAERHRRAARAHQHEARTDDEHSARIEDGHLTIEADVVEEGEEASEGGRAEGEPRPSPAAEEAQLMRLEDAVDALPALVRLAAGMWLRTAAWGMGASVRVGAQLARAATDPEAALELYEGLSDGVRAYAREFLGISDIDERVRQLTPLAGSAMRQNGTRPQIDLRAQGEQLLRQAADVGYEQEAHPAYARILSELSPDEARILRLLAIEGPQALVDVRAQNLIGLGSQLVTPGLNMIGAQAGVRWRERVPAYLNNLGRLGLIYVSDEALPDPISYQVLEAQPDVLGVIKDTPRAKTVHRSIRLTPFGQDFCSVCLPLDPALPAEPDAPQLPSGGVEEEARG